MNRDHITLAISILLLILLLFIGCLGGKPDPLTPGPGSEETYSEGNSMDGNVLDTANTPCLWGYYQVAYDSSRHTIDAIPLRGPAFALNVVKFLQPPLGSLSGMTIGVLDDSGFLSSGRIDVRILLHHPFSGMLQYTGFDVCGIFITEGSITSPSNSNLTYADPVVDPTLLNPDGYTRWMNPSEFLSGDVLGYEPGFWGTSESSENSGFLAGATINPYKYFVPGLGYDESLTEWLGDPASIAGRGMFPDGVTCARDYELLFPIVSDQIVFFFNYAVLANWAEPVVDPVTDPLTDFPPEANAQYPLHIIVTDNSQVYYTSEDAGGTLSFDIEIFDWGASDNPAGVPGEIFRFIIWSDEALVPGGYVEILSTEVEWNSGFTASTSVAHVELVGMIPEVEGETGVWIAIESTNPSSYDQGLGAIVPDDPIATYARVPIVVADCSQSFINGLETGAGSSGSYLDDVTIYGEGFIDGNSLGVWLEQMSAGGAGAGSQTNYVITATDVKYIDENTISADFDLTGAYFGNYGCGCINGCGIVTTPEENNDKAIDDVEIDVLPPFPVEISLSTDRDDSDAVSIKSLDIDWESNYDVDYYDIYAKGYDVNGNLVFDTIVGSTEDTYFVIVLGALPLGDAGVLEVWLTATGELESIPYESLPSRHTFMYFQGFETGMGAWDVRSEDPNDLEFVRSTVDAAFSGTWGLKTYGDPWYWPVLWIAFATPPIPEVDGASTVNFEFLHRQKEIHPYHGYQVGWCTNLPDNGDPSVTDYHPINTVAYGFEYNDYNSTALQSEFNIAADEDNNFQASGDIWTNWYLSGFDASEVIGDGQANYVLVGFAGNYYYDVVKINIDEVAVLIY